MNEIIAPAIERIRSRHFARKAVRRFGAEVLFNADDAASIVSFDKRYDGGPGSGNFNHEGRPGKVGGSAPSDGPDDDKTSGVESVARKLKCLTDGETVSAQDLRFGAEITLEKRYGDDESMMCKETGEVISISDLLDSKKFSVGKTGREIHDEQYDLSPRFKTKAD